MKGGDGGTTLELMEGVVVAGGGGNAAAVVIVLSLIVPGVPMGDSQEIHLVADFSFCTRHT